MSDIKKIKPSLSKGTRDFLPSEVARRNYIFETIKMVFRRYGFEQIETPAIERLETLTGKYGEEGDKLLFKILNSGDYLKDVRPLTTDNRQPDVKDVTPLIAEKGLRYDLTVPLARYVVQHQDKLAFPFRRFHIGPVWRADRPQKGRYQEFYQCDADIIGSSSLLNEAELTLIYAEVFRRLGLEVEIRINNRKLIDEIIRSIGGEEKKKEIITIADKLDKMEWVDAAKEWCSIGLTDKQIDNLKSLLYASAEDLKKKFADTEAIKEVETLMQYLKGEKALVLDSKLMRGLDYYTGTIWEVKSTGTQIGSLGGGGRYDNLTEMFGGQNLSGVGISFGIERIYDVMEELNLFPKTVLQGVKVLFVPRDVNATDFTFSQVQTLRDQGVSAEIFLGNVKKKKQFDYAEAKHISFMVEVGDDEIKNGLFRLRNIHTRETINDLTREELTEKLSEA